jgi:hypothetical protein
MIQQKMPAMIKSVRVKNISLLLSFLSLIWTVYLFSQDGSSQTDAANASDFNFADSLAKDSLKTDEIVSEIDSVYYFADSVFYSIQQEKIILAGNARLKYQGSEIISDTINIDLEKEQAFALGKSSMKEGDQLILGEDIYFDLATRWGLLISGASKFDKGYYYGDEIRKIDRKTFDVDNGIFTTCDALHPHFYIGGSKLRLYQDDKVVGKPVVFYVNNFPVMGFPFGTFTIKRGRQSGILVPSPGWNDANGKYLENIAYYYAYKDYADATLALDYYEKTGWQVGLTSQYIKRYIFNGNFSAILQKRISGPLKSTNEWNIKSRHHHELGNRSTFDADLNFVSSSLIWEGSEDPNERLAEEIKSSIAYKRPFLGSYLNVSANYVHDLLGQDVVYVLSGDTANVHIEKKTITLPSISFYLPSKPFYELFLKDADSIPEEAWWKPFSYSYNFKAVQTGYTKDPDASLSEIIWNNQTDDNDVIIDLHNAGIKHSASVSYNYKLRGWLSLRETVAGNEVWFDRDKNDNRFVRAGDYSSTSSIGFNLFGLRQISGIYIKAVRHIITPQISYYYQPDFSENEKFYSFSGINVKNTKKQRRMTYSLDNKWSLKLKKNKKLEERKINDFFTISSNISYDFEAEDKGFSNINHSLRLNPNRFIWKLVEFSTTPSGSIEQATYDLKFSNLDFKHWDFGIKNWNFNIRSKLAFSGEAAYLDYFPVPENQFQTSRFFSPDTLHTEDERMITTLQELDNLQKEKKSWSISFSHAYSTNKTSYENNNYTSDLRIAVNARISLNWSISYDNYINLKTDEVISHNISITRDLHCWQVFFRYTQQGDYWNYRFQLFNLKLPDALKFRTSDHKR